LEEIPSTLSILLSSDLFIYLFIYLPIFPTAQIHLEGRKEKKAMEVSIPGHRIKKRSIGSKSIRLYKDNIFQVQLTS
jgi:hypothetical protein